MNDKEYFKQIDYALALGTDKVGILKVSTYEFQHYKTMTNEEIRNDVEQLQITNQWEYQVENAIHVYLQTNHFNNDTYVEKFHELQNYVIDGYIDGIHTLINKK